MNFIANTPNASKLIGALRHLEYNNLSAMNELVDNSIDAGSSQIAISILGGSESLSSEVSAIMVADNGSGMTKDILDEALRLGAGTVKNTSCDLGWFGMGLNTSSISVGTRLKVITRTAKGKWWTSVQDLEWLYEQGAFVKTLEESSSDEILLFNNMIGKGAGTQNSGADPIGTLVIVDSIDNCQWRKVSTFAEHLMKYLGRTYRKFLQSGKIKITVNDQTLVPIDPIYDFEPTILLEDDMIIGDEKAHVVIAELHDYGAVINRDKGINAENAGFYVLRNNREIMAGAHLNIFTRHNDFNLMRIEFSFPATLDDELCANFSKTNIVLSQSIRNKLEAICNPYIKQIRKKAKARGQVNPEQMNLSFGDVEKFITQKSHLLKRPQVEVAERAARSVGEKTEHERIKKALEEGSPKLNITKRKRISIDSCNVRFDRKTLGEKGPVYEADQERDIVVIYWNVDHPFFREFIEAHANEPDIFNPICFLVYGMANAELIARPNSDSLQILENIRYDVGRNLAVLLK